MSVMPSELARTLVRRASARRAADDGDRERCRREIALALPLLRLDLGFARAWVIGSLAWGGFGVRSDIDIVIAGGPSDISNTIAERIGEATGRSVDVLELETLPASFQRRVLADGIHVA